MNVKCSYCKQWGKERTNCEFCGASIEPIKAPEFYHGKFIEDLTPEEYDEYIKWRYSPPPIVRVYSST